MESIHSAGARVNSTENLDRVLKQARESGFRRPLPHGRGSVSFGKDAAFETDARSILTSLVSAIGPI